MKNLKVAFLSMFIALFVVTSCTNEEAVIDDQQQTEESESITTALNQLSTQFDANGLISTQSNPSGNIVLDFCFDFVYPLTLSYNNGTSVTVDDLDGLIDVMLGTTNELYISGIAFPFNVETFNDDTDTIEVETINNEVEFIELILSCGFDDVEECACFEIYDPVCVEITDPTGETFIVTYPNECYAECDGFDEDDFVEDCEDDYYAGGFECFEFNYPISVITEDGEVITINSEEELGTALYDVYVFDFEYPFTVTVHDDEDETEVITINSAEDLEEIIEDCYDDYYDDDYEDCEECEDEPIDPVCVEIITASGDVVYEVFPNECYAECLGFDEDDFVDCDDNNPVECSETDITNNLSECDWYVFSTLTPQSDFEIDFEEDGTLTAETDTDIVSGTWQISTNPNGVITMTLSIPAPLDGLNNFTWTVTECTDEFVLLETNNGQLLSLERDCE